MINLLLIIGFANNLEMLKASNFSFQNKMPVKVPVYPFAHQFVGNHIVDSKYAGTACNRLMKVIERLTALPEDTFLNKDWNEIRSKLLWCGGLKQDRSTSHAFNDDNHCDLTTMKGEVQQNSNQEGTVQGISTRNFLGAHIEAASLPELGEGGSWSTCTNGCHRNPPHDVAHVQFNSRVAFKLVWCPPNFEKFVLVDDEGKLLKVGKPNSTDPNLPHISYRENNYRLTRGGIYATEAENEGQR